MRTSPYILQTKSTIKLLIPFDWSDKVSVTQFHAICIAMYAWSIDQTRDITTEIGWEFSKEFTPTMIQSALNKLGVPNVEVIEF